MAALLLGALGLFPACKSTYSRDKIKDEIAQLAQKEYRLRMEVVETGDTVTARYYLKNLRGELVADDQKLWRDSEHMLMVLSRVTLSMDNPPRFFVLELIDSDNPNLRFTFTRYIDDIKKYFAEAVSMTQFFDSLIMEFVIGNDRKIFDPEEMDLVRFLLMSLAADETQTGKAADVVARDIPLRDFVAQVAANRVKRFLRERSDIKEGYFLRQVLGQFEQKLGEFKILIDIVPKPAQAEPVTFYEKTIFPLAAKVSSEVIAGYKIRDFEKILVSEKHSGKVGLFPRK